MHPDTALIEARATSCKPPYGPDGHACEVVNHRAWYRQGTIHLSMSAGSCISLARRTPGVPDFQLRQQQAGWRHLSGPHPAAGAHILQTLSYSVLLLRILKRPF